MKPIQFPEVNHTFAKNQPQYRPLPGHKVDDPKGEFIFCMKLSFVERLRILFWGNLWCSLLTFNQPLTPSFFTTKKSDLFNTTFSWFGRLNYYLLQFFFIRLTRHQELEQYWFSIQYWIWPLSGWVAGFKYVGKRSPRYFVITKRFAIN